MRACNYWGDALAALPGARKSEVLDLGDNFSAVCAYTRGRAQRPEHNRQCRRRAAFSAALEITFRDTWIDTTHQAADGGTRPVNGKLVLGKIYWRSARNWVVHVFSGCGRLEAYLRVGEVVLDSWDILLGRAHDLHQWENARRLYRLLESGLVIVAFWGTPCTKLTRARKYDGRGPGSEV